MINIDKLEIISGMNSFQSARIEKNEKTIDYQTSSNLSYLDIVSIAKGLDVISEFFDVNAVVTTSGSAVCAVALGKSLEDAMIKAIDGNPVEFINATVVLSGEVNSDIVKMLKNSNKIAAPGFTKNAVDYLESHNIAYITINTPLKDYKKYLSEEIRVTPLGTLIQTPNLNELNKDTFKVVSAVKPTVEQIEDAVFAWKIAKHANSRAVVIAKDLKTSAVLQGLQSMIVEHAMDFACDMSKDAVLASDLPVTIHDINAMAQGRISMIILPEASTEVINAANKFNIALITTGFTNRLY